jgi:hypothetical protein
LVISVEKWRWISARFCTEMAPRPRLEPWTCGLTDSCQSIPAVTPNSAVVVSHSQSLRVGFRLLELDGEFAQSNVWLSAVIA